MFKNFNAARAQSAPFRALGKIDHVLRRVPDEHIRYVPYRSCPGYGLSRGVPAPRCAMALAETPVGGLTFQLASLPLYLKYELFLEALE